MALLFPGCRASRTSAPSISKPRERSLYRCLVRRALPSSLKSRHGSVRRLRSTGPGSGLTFRSEQMGGSFCHPSPGWNVSGGARSGGVASLGRRLQPLCLPGTIPSGLLRAQRNCASPPCASVPPCASLPPLAGVECFWGGLVPAVSLRSTAGYNLCSLREQSPPDCCALREIVRPPVCASEKLCVPPCASSRGRRRGQTLRVPA
jgi:hypothetical protein